MDKQRNRGKLVRVDIELEQQIKEFARKNEMSFRQASREIANLNKVKFKNKKIIKEIKF